MRFVGQGLGAEVEWLGKTRQVKITMGEQTIVLKVGSKEVTVNGNVLTINTIPFITKGNSCYKIRVPLHKDYKAVLLFSVFYLWCIILLFFTS